MIIYGIKNKETGRIVYIGQTIRPLSHRWTQHLRDSKVLDYPLYRAVRKYGSDKFECFQIERCSDLEALDKREIELTIKHETLLPNGYNLNLGRKDGRHDQSTVEKIRAASIKNGFGKWERTEEHNESNSKLGIQRHADPEFRQKFLIANGSKLFNVYKAVVVIPHKRGKTGIVEKGEFVGTWLSSIDCAKDLNISGSNIRDCLLKRKKTHKGLVFEYQSLESNKEN